MSFWRQTHTMKWLDTHWHDISAEFCPMGDDGVLPPSLDMPPQSLRECPILNIADSTKAPAQSHYLKTVPTTPASICFFFGGGATCHPCFSRTVPNLETSEAHERKPCSIFRLSQHYQRCLSRDNSRKNSVLFGGLSIESTIHNVN